MERWQVSAPRSAFRGDRAPAATAQMAGETPPAAGDGAPAQTVAGKSAPTAAGETAPETTAPMAGGENPPAQTASENLPPFGSTPYRDTTALAVLGKESVTVASAPLPLARPASLTENAGFQGFVLLLGVTYALLLLRHLTDVRTLLGRVSRNTASGKRMAEDPGSSAFPRFLNLTTAIGMLLMGVAVVKYADWLPPEITAGASAHGIAPALSLLAALACAAVAAFQWAALRTVGAITLLQPFVGQLILLKRTYFSLAVLVASPAMLLFALCPPGRGGVWFCVVAAELLVTAILYLWESLRLFLSKKISILHWFLYLCVVELCPLSLLWLLAVR